MGREKAVHKHIFDKSRVENFRNKPDALVAAIDAYIDSHHRMMTLQPAKVEVIKEVLQTMNPPPRTIVELGTYIGHTAVAFGAMLRELHADSSTKMSQCRVYSMELEPTLARIAQDFVDLAGLNGEVEVVQGAAAESLTSLHESGRLDKIDLLLIDHWEKFYVSDLRVCEDLGLFRKGTVVVADNTDIPGAPDYLEYVRSGGSGRVKYENVTRETTSKAGVPVSLRVLLNKQKLADTVESERP